MQVRWALGVQEFAQPDDAPLVLVGLGGDTTPVLKLPCPGAWLKAAICLTIEYDEIVPGGVLPLLWEVHNPENEICGEGGVEMPLLERSERHRAGWQGHHVQGVLIEFDASTDGAYPIVFRLLDSEPFTLIHYVELRSAPS